MPKKLNVFVLGLTDFQRRSLATVPHAERYAFHALLSYDEAVQEHAGFEDLLRRARQQLERFAGSVDAILCHWDFPSSCLAPVLCEEYGLPGPSLSSVLKCEHKYWARLEQSRVVSPHVPRFVAVDPFDISAVKRLEQDLGYPFWLKPIKGFSSMLGFRIDRRSQLEEALARTRHAIGILGHAFNEALARVDMPAEVAGVGGLHCIAESIVKGVQAAPEGHVHHGQMHVHGVLDMVRDRNRKSFSRLQYPSRLPQGVQSAMSEVSRKVLREVGFDNSCFNAEFMWDRTRDRLWLIEVNTRMSQSHAPLFAKVDGASNHAIALDLALGRKPSFPQRQGRYPMAGKFWLNHYGDAVVERVPSQAELRELEQRLPGDPEVEVSVHAGQRLSELPNQDVYRYVVAELYLGARHPRDLLYRYRQCVAGLDLRFADIQPSSTARNAG